MADTCRWGIVEPVAAKVKNVEVLLQIRHRQLATNFIVGEVERLQVWQHEDALRKLSGDQAVAFQIEPDDDTSCSVGARAGDAARRAAVRVDRRPVE